MVDCEIFTYLKNKKLLIIIVNITMPTNCLKKPIWSRCSFYGETRRLICTSRNWRLSQTEFLTKDADPFLADDFSSGVFSHIFTIANELTVFSISRLANMEDFFKGHCVKSVQIWIYFWSVFSCIWTEYGEIWSLRIQSEYRKMWTRNNSVFGHFSRSEGVDIASWYFFSQIKSPEHAASRVSGVISE